jgi:hypothetical protein
MPKEGDPLTKEEVALIERWIVDGAKTIAPALPTSIFSKDKPPVYPSRRSSRR